VVVFRPKGERLIDFNMFLNCLNEVADRKFSKKVANEKARREVVYNNVIGKAPELVGITVNLSFYSRARKISTENLPQNTQVFDVLE